MISLLDPRFPRDARVPDAAVTFARGYVAMCREHGVPLSMGGSALEPDHSIAAPPRSQADAVTVAPRRGAARKPAPLPRIVRFISTTDSPDSTCPHCGATGRYIHHFEVEGGQRRGAMRGCVQLFPVAPIAREHMRLAAKAEQRAKKGWQLSRADLRALDAIEAFYRGETTESAAMAHVLNAKSAAAAWARGRR